MMLGQTSGKKSDSKRKAYEILGVSKYASEDDVKKAYRKAALKNPPDEDFDMLIAKVKRNIMLCQTSLKKSDNKRKIYEILGVSKYASQDDVKKAYLKAALKNHPDEGGDADTFEEVAQAYKVLSDPVKREKYDQYGEDALKEGIMGGGHDPPAIFRYFFGGIPFRGAGGGGGGSSSRGRKREGDSIVLPLEVSLEDLYHGASKKHCVSRNVICSKCKGKGGASTTCAGCQGSGMKVSLGLSHQRMRVACNECNGSGERIDDKDRCTECKGEKKTQETKVYELNVEKGMRTAQMIKFPGEADEDPDSVTGDVVFLVLEEMHPKFKREGDDLFVEHTLSLTEALCGFQFILTHLDHRKLLIKSQPGQVVKPDEIKVINDEGMPVYGRPWMRGKLCIRFRVEYFPEPLTPEQCKALEAVLPPRTSMPITDTELDECEETTLLDFQK